MNRLLLAAALVLAPSAALALDPPHDGSQGTSCSDCHRMHNALGDSLTNVEGNANLCQSCHVSVTDPDGKHFGFPWTANDQAVPGASGHSHRWDADVTSRGARAPISVDMALRLDQGKISCATCHDEHNNGGVPGDATFRGGAQHVGGPNGSTVIVGDPFFATSGVSTGRMNLATVTSQAAPKGYRIRLSAVDATTVRFKISHDAGKSWYAWSAGAWVQDIGGTGLGKPATAASPDPVDLDDGANVRITFPDAAATYAANSYWDFWVSYSMLRIANANDEMCVDCHADRVHTRSQIEGLDPTLPANGTTVYSHPVNEPLSEARNHRTTPLDADGSTGGDTNPTNDLVVVGGVVRCTTCHAVHNADSNSLTRDP